MTAKAQQYWFYMHAGLRYGPLTSRELKAVADAGGLDPGDWVRKEDMDDWVRAEKVRGLCTTKPAQSFSDAATAPPSLTVSTPPSSPPPPPRRMRTGDDTKSCPFCAETILRDARKCKHCGEFLDDSLKKQGKAFFKTSGDFIGLMCSYHILDSRKNVLAKLKPNQSFEVPILADVVMYVWYSCGFAGAVGVNCRAHEVNRFSISMSQMGLGCVVSRVDIIDSA